MKRLFYLLIASSLFFNFSCKSGKKAEIETDDNQAGIYFDYRINANEGDDNLTLLLQYKMGEPDDEAIAIEGATVWLDGEIIKPDSSVMTGTYYEIHKPINSFIGKHTILFRDADKNDYKEEFEFKRFALLTFIPDSIPRDTLYFQFEGLEQEDYIRTVLIDTSFFNDGINRLDTVINGQLVVPAEKLRRLATGPVHLEFIREYERPVKNGTPAWGKFQIMYTLKRDFILKN